MPAPPAAHPMPACGLQAARAGKHSIVCRVPTLAGLGFHLEALRTKLQREPYSLLLRHAAAQLGTAALPSQREMLQARPGCPALPLGCLCPVLRIVLRCCYSAWEHCMPADAALSFGMRAHAGVPLLLLFAACVPTLHAATCRCLACAGGGGACGRWRQRPLPVAAGHRRAGVPRGMISPFFCQIANAMYPTSQRVAAGLLALHAGCAAARARWAGRQAWWAGVAASAMRFATLPSPCCTPEVPMPASWSNPPPFLRCRAAGW